MDPSDTVTETGCEGAPGGVLPTGIFYAQGVQANVRFVERKPTTEPPWTPYLWIYDLRTNKHFTRKRNPLTLRDTEDFIACYNPGERHNQKESERFRSFGYDELADRDKTNLDIFGLKDDSLEDTENLPPPGAPASPSSRT